MLALAYEVCYLLKRTSIESVSLFPILTEAILDTAQGNETESTRSPGRPQKTNHNMLVRRRLPWSSQVGKWSFYPGYL
eukprot:5368802-Amphidinium_carterae.1